MAKQPSLEIYRDLSVKEVARVFKRNQRKLKVHEHDGPIKSIRTAKHNGREIKITATYDIRIDGRRVGGHLEVNNDGQVHNHGLPNYKWASMIDMCKQLVNSFPEDFPKRKVRAKTKKQVRAKPTQKTSVGKRKGS